MRLRIRAPHVEISAETRRAIERNFRLALGRHAAGIDRAQITLSPSSRVGARSLCRIRVHLGGGVSLEIEQHDEDPRAAAAAAARRLEQRLERRRAARWVGPSAPRRVGSR